MQKLDVLRKKADPGGEQPALKPGQLCCMQQNFQNYATKFCCML